MHGSPFRGWNWLVLWLALALALILLSIHAAWHQPATWEARVLGWVQTAEGSATRSLAIALTRAGEGPIWLAIVALLAAGLWRIGRQRLGLVLVLLVPLRLVGSLLKALVARPRPAEPVVTVWEPLGDFGFPSNHGLAVTLVFGFLMLVLPATPLAPWPRRWLQLGCGVVIGLMGWARLAVGAHWPTDVLGGYLLGLLLLLPIIATLADPARRRADCTDESQSTGMRRGSRDGGASP